MTEQVWIKCPECDGHGMHEFPDSHDQPYHPYSEYRYLPCAWCRGLGQIKRKAEPVEGK